MCTSDLWAARRLVKSSGARTSRCRMVLSRLPVLSRWLLQAMQPTRALWPAMLRTL